MPVQAFTLYSDTPTLTVIEPRGLTVRSVSYCRSAIGEAADERINRTAYDGAGRAIAQWDSRLATDASAPANLVTIVALSGKSLSTTSVDAGWRVSLLGDADQPVQGWDGRGSQRWSEYDNQLRPSALFEQRWLSKKKPPPNPLRIGKTQRAGRGLLVLLNAYCAMVFTDTPRSIGVERP